MFVAIVEVGIMRMPVQEPFVPMPMRMWLCQRSVMGALVMFVVVVLVVVLDRLAPMFMAMSFGQMKPEAERDNAISF